MITDFPGLRKSVSVNFQLTTLLQVFFHLSDGTSLAQYHYQGGRHMDAVYCDKLQDRQKEVQTTLRHLYTERQELEANIKTVDRVAWTTRVNLLEDLTT